MEQATFEDAPYLNAGPFADYYLREGVQSLGRWDCDAAAGAALDRLRAMYADERERVDARDGTELVDVWIDPVLDALGFERADGAALPGSVGSVDGLLLADAGDSRAATRRERDGDPRETPVRASAIIDIQQWNAGSGERRNDRDAVHRIDHTLQRTPDELAWGITTDGRRWRLYGTGDHRTRTYYEVDLPALVQSGDLQQFKYFYAFFGADAFRERNGTTFLDTVRAESETAAEDLGADLRDDVPTALEVLGRGFVDGNDLAVDPDDDAALAELRDQSLVYLYRLMALFYAEDWGSLRPDAPVAEAGDERETNFGMDALRTEIYGTVRSGGGFADAYSDDSTSIYDRLSDLFGLLDAGELGVPAYPGDLFDRDDHTFLAEHAVGDRHLAEVVHLLSTVENDEGERVLVDYADLDTRHLGSVHEAALEREFQVTARAGLSLVDDEGERKASGSFYTPDDVVTYVVEETVGPLVDDVEADLRARGLEPGEEAYFREFYAAVRDLRILDPAMGSGHFLTAATDYLAGRVLAVAREHGRAGLAKAEIRRTVAEECLYGVDLDGTAVELAHLSMWLETLAADRPLESLEDHLRTGNSLVGIRGPVVPDVGGVAAKATSADYDELRDDRLDARLAALANVRTAERFGLEVPADAYERLGRAIEDDEEWAEVRAAAWFRRAQATAREVGFFHWELAFPEVFDGDNGERGEGGERGGDTGERSSDAGFDAVIGNPPWVATAGRAEISAKMDRSVRSYLEAELTTTDGQFDLYVAFYERFLSLSRAGHTGIVVPDAILTREQNAPIRQHVLDTAALRRIVDIGTAFEGVETGAAILITGDGDTVECADPGGETFLDEVAYTSIPVDVFREAEAYRFLIHLDEETRGVLATVDSHPPLSGRIRISRGEEIGKRAAFLAETDREHRREIVPGGAIVPYGLDDTETRYVPDERIEKDRRNYESPKLCFRQTADSLVGTYDEASRITIKSAYNIHTPGMTDRQTKALLGVLNSTLLEYYHDRKHGAYRSVFPQINQSTFESFPVPVIEDDPELADLVDRRLRSTERMAGLDRSLLDHLGTYGDGQTLATVGSARLPEGADGSILRQTGARRPTLRVGGATVERESPDTVEIRLTARYRPDDGTARETDPWGYVETEPLPALRITGLAETTADLIAAFVPVAVDEAGGFAAFYADATKTNSPIDRLRALTMPALADVRDGLESYLETRARAEELAATIERTDDLIDEAVYERYGLTDGEIETVERTVDG